MELNNFKQQIIKDINTSGLTIDAVYFVLKDVMNEVVGLFNKQVEMESAAVAQESKNETKDLEPTAADNKDKEEE